MTPLVVIFCCCIVIFALAIVIYEKREATASQSVLIELKKAQSDIKRLEDLVSSNVSTCISVRSRVEQMESVVGDRLKKCDDALEIFRDQVSETREKQMKLQDVLSQKRPVVKLPQGAIQVEIFQGTPKKPVGKGVKSLIRERSQ